MTNAFQFVLLFMCWSFPVCHYKATDPEEEKTKGLIINIVVVEDIVFQDLPDHPVAFTSLGRSTP